MFIARVESLILKMGNSSNKTYHRPRRKYASEYSLSDMIGGSCSRGRESIREEFYRPTSFASRRSRSIGILDDRLDSSKTVWPVSRSEAIFLPEFKVREDPTKVDYNVLDLIAKGAYGRVYKVVKRSNEKIYAMKMIGKAKIVEENAIGQVKQEVSIQRVVGHHPFVARTLEHWQGRKTLYIIMDYLAGGELLSLIEDYGSLPEAVVRIYVGEISLAIDFLHNAGIVHRDIKASNVLLDNEGHAVLIDFGLAKWLQSNQRTSTFCGTPEYMAPEIFGKELYGHSVDWWSLGVLACFALTNKKTHFKRLHETDIAPGNIGALAREIDDYGALAAIVNLSDPSAGKYPYTEKNTKIVSWELDGPSTGTGDGEEQVLTSVVLPDCTELSSAAKDLLRRLLEPDPRLRLKSIFSLQRIAFYMDQEIRSYISKEISPLRLLGRKFESPAINPPPSLDQELFRNFDTFQ